MNSLTIKLQDRNHKWNITEWMILSLVLLNIADFATTYVAVGIIGHIEANPILNYLINLTGTIWIVFVLKFLVFSYLIVSYELFEKFRIKCQSITVIGAFAILNIIYTAIVLHNTYLIMFDRYIF